jgi:hypothetical protein
MVNIFAKAGLTQPSSFSAKPPDWRHGTAIASQPGFRKSGDCEPFAAEFSGESEATPPFRFVSIRFRHSANYNLLSSQPNPASQSANAMKQTPNQFLGCFFSRREAQSA